MSGFTVLQFGTSLERLETSPQVNLPERSDSDLLIHRDSIFRHTGWKFDRLRVYEALKRTGAGIDRIWNFTQCGHGAFVLRNPDNPTEYRICGECCHDRFCLPCANTRSHIIAANVLAQLRGKQARFITLTLHSTTEPLADLLRKLGKCFTRLRSHSLWRKTCYGGVAFIEVKWKPDLNRWNVHLHCLALGKYLKQGLLSQLWFKVTGTSPIVDVRFVHNEQSVARYVTKYASKPLDHSVLHEPDRLDEAIRSLKGKRLCTTFGNWRGVKLSAAPDTAAWEYVDTLASIINRALAGEPHAQAIAKALGIPSVFPLPPEKPPPKPRPLLFQVHCGEQFNLAPQPLSARPLQWI